MVSVLIIILGMLITGGTLGYQVVETAGYLEYWYWFTSILTSIISLIIIVAMTFGGWAVASDARLSGIGKMFAMTGGGILGTIISVLLCGSQWVLLWISIWIQNNVNVKVENWSDFSQDSKTAIIGLLVIVLLLVLKSRNSSKD